MKKWFKRLFIFGGGLFLIVLIGVFIEWQYTVSQGRDQLRKTRAALDESDPGWRLDEIIVKRNQNLPPDQENVAAIALAAIKLFPEEFSKWELAETMEWRSELKLGHLVDPDELAVAREKVKSLNAGLVALREIRKFPRGGNKIVIPEPDPLQFVLTDTQKLREAASKLDWQALIAANDNDSAIAIDANRTLAHLRHAVGDEPTLISQLVRLAITAIAVRSTERTLSLTEPKQGLAELQSDFEKALTETYFIGGIKGERAIVDRILENIAAGKLGASAGAGIAGSGNGGLVSALENIALGRFIRPNHVTLLEILTATCDALKKTGPERLKAIDAIPMPATRSVTNIFIFLLLPAIQKVIEAETRCETNLGTIVVALACERYRIKNGKWPEKLTDIPPDILKTIPSDPYIGGPLRIKLTETGIVIYSTGKDGIDNGGLLDSTGTKAGTDIGIQLFDPTHRRKPALPKMPKDDNEAIPAVPGPKS